MYKCRRMGERHGIGWPLHLLPGGGRRGTLNQSRCGFDLDDEAKREVDNRKKKNRGGCGIPVGEGRTPVSCGRVGVGAGAAAAVGALCVVRVCLPEPPQCPGVLPARPAGLHLRAHLHFPQLGGGYPGTWVHSLIHSFVLVHPPHPRPTQLESRSALYTTTVLPRRRSKKEVELLCSCGTDCTYGAWALGPYGDTGPPITQQQSTSGLRCQVTAVAAGGVEGVGASSLPSPLSVSLFFLFLFVFWGACPHLGRYAQLGILHLILNP